MKKLITLHLALMPFLLSAQYAYKSVVTLTFGKISFDLYCKTGTFGFGQQFYPANFFNNTFYDIHVKGEYVATLTCGNEAVSQLDFTCKKYSSVIHVDVNGDNFPYEMPSHYGTDFSGLVGVADEKSCLGNEVTVQSGADGTKIKTRDRISALGIRHLQLFAIQSDGSEVPMTDEGVLISPPPGNDPPKKQTTTVTTDSPSQNTTTSTNGNNNVRAQQPRQSTAQNQQEVYQQQANNYLNAANHSTTEANNAAVVQSVNDLGNAVGNLIAAHQSKKEQERQEMAERDAYDRESERRATAQQQEEQRQAREQASMFAEDSINKMNNIATMLGLYASTMNLPLSSLPNDRSVAYCVAIIPRKWDRTNSFYLSGDGFDYCHTYDLFKLVTIERSSNGAWPDIDTVYEKLFKASFGGKDDYTPVLAGFFADRADAINLGTTLGLDSHGGQDPVLIQEKPNIEGVAGLDLIHLKQYDQIDSSYKKLENPYFAFDSRKFHRYNLLNKLADVFLQTYNPKDYPTQFALVAKIKSEVADTLAVLLPLRKEYLALRARIPKFKQDTVFPYLQRFVDAYNNEWDNLPRSCKSSPETRSDSERVLYGKLVLDTAHTRVIYAGTESVSYLENGMGYANIQFLTDPITQQRYITSSKYVTSRNQYSIILGTKRNKCRIDNAGQILLELQQVVHNCGMDQLSSERLINVVID